MGGEVRYCTTEDGVRIAYCVEGEGPPLLATPFFLESFSLDHIFPEYIDHLRRSTPGRRLIRFDTRGTGLSQREVDDISNDGLVRDMEAVVRALELKRFTLWATAIGGFRALAFAARHPDVLDRLVLHGAFARLADVFSDEALLALAAMCRFNWDMAVRTLADFASRRESEELGLRLADLFSKSTSDEVAARLCECNVGLDLTPELPQVRVPALVLHEVGDSVFPVSLAQKLAAALPDARLIPLPGSTWVNVGGIERVSSEVRAFLADAAPSKVKAPPPLAARFQAILFTDLAGHTEMMQRLGDQRGREVLREQERITRELLNTHGGSEVKSMGDGFMASFASVTRAVECAIALQRAFEERNQSAEEPLSVRVGLNAGEPIEEEGDVFGATVILAARVAAKARGSEILVSDVVRGLCSGKGFLFADCGEHVLRGFEDPVRVYEVAWRQ